MAARGTFSFSRPEKVEMTLQVTMSMEEWKTLKSRLRPQADSADWYLDASIADMLDKANKEFRFYEEVIKPKPEGDK